MGEVYLADDTVLKRPVALKCIAPQLRADPRYRQRFLREAERASALNHPHVAGVYDVLEDQGMLFLVMEYVEGTSLRSRMSAPLPLDQFLDVAVQTAEALAAAHEKNIVHADIKPENIMLSVTGQVKVLDFGVAKRLPAGGDSPQSTETTSGAGSFSGTPGYMAPEVLLEKPVDHRADIFSLGVVFYEAVSGWHPFREAGFMATADRILRENPPPLSQRISRLPEELDRIVEKMLAKDPAERYASAADLLVDLRAVRRDAVTPQLTPRRRPAPVARNWFRIVVVACVAVVGLALTFSPWSRREVRKLFGIRMVPSPKYVAVLPFEVPGGNRERIAFSDGLTEAVTARLTQLTATHLLQVAPASDVRKFRGGGAEQAGKELGVNLAVSGSLLFWQDKVRVTVALVNVRERQQLRATVVDTASNDLMALESRVVAAVLEMLEEELHPPEREAIEAQGTKIAAARESYLRGRGYLQTYDRPESIQSAMEVFQHALQLDPNYASIHAGLGEAYLQKYATSKETRWIEAARQSCERALALDAKLAAAHVCLGTLHDRTGEYEKAAGEFRRALESEPTSDDAYRGLAAAYANLGKFNDAETTYNRAIQVRPHYWAGYNWLGVYYISRARYNQAAQMFAQVVALAPDNALGYRNLGAVYALEGRYPEAITALARSVALRPTARAFSNLATAYFNLGRFGEAARTYEEAIQIDDRDNVVWGNLGDAYYWLPGKRAQAMGAYQRAIVLVSDELRVNPRSATGFGNLAKYYAMLDQKEQALFNLQKALALAPTDPALRMKAALVYNRFGEVDRALAWSEKAVEAGFSRTTLRDDPVFNNLRSNKRFQELLREPAARSR